MMTVAQREAPPAGIMGVRGTKVHKTVRWQAPLAGTYVGVNEGAVIVHPWNVDLCVRVSEDSPSTARSKIAEFASGGLGVAQYLDTYGVIYPELLCHPNREMELLGGEESASVKTITPEEIDYYEALRELDYARRHEPNYRIWGMTEY